MEMNSKMYDNFDPNYNTSLGSIKTTEKFTMRIAFDKNRRITNPYLAIFPIDKWEQLVNYPMYYEKEQNGYNWYKVELNISKASVYFYFFKLNINGCYNELKKTKNYENILDSKGELYQLTVYENNFTIEESYKGGTMYQIFPDRFHNSGTAKENVPEDRTIREDWGGTPEYRPNYQGKITNSDYFGGDLKGITQKLDYLVELGVTVVYINPIFEAHTNHRYDTANYLNIDPLLGTEEDFKELCSEAKKRGIVIILDGVFSHTGSDSVYFNKNNRYDTLGAYNSKFSDYYSWYKFDNYPYSYKSWWGFDTLPELDKYNKSYVDFICSDNGVIHKWLEAGAYGFRLDVADELPPSFLDRIKEAVVKYGGKMLIGEVWEDATTKRGYGQVREYLLGKQLDSVMNYPFKEAILAYVRYGSRDYFYQTVMSIIENYPKEVLDSLMNMLSTHDTQRALTKLAAEEVNDHDRYWQAGKNTLSFDQYNFGKKLIKLATVIQYFLPGLPCIYYGDECGLYGYKDPFNRGCYPWNNEDNELVDFFKELGKLRKENDVFKEGYFKILYLDNDICTLERFDKNESIILIVNRTNNSKNIYNRIPSVLQYEEIAQFGNYDNYWLHAFSSVIFKRQ